MRLREDLDNFKTAFGVVFSERKYYLITVFVGFAIVFFLNFAVNTDLIVKNMLSDYDIWKKLALMTGLFQGTFTNNTPQTLSSE